MKKLSWPRAALPYLDKDMSAHALPPRHGHVHGRRRGHQSDVGVLRGGGLYAGRNGLARLVAPMDDAGAVVGRLQAEG